VNALWVAAAVVVGLLLVRRVIAMAFVRSAFRAGLGDVGKEALARQFDHVHLAPRNSSAWQDAAQATDLVTPLQQQGFQDAGVFSVDEIPGVVLELLSKPAEGLTAIVYEHPKVGHWIEVVARYPDGTSTSVTNSKTVAMDGRPGHPRVRMPDAGPSQLVERARRESSGRAFIACPPELLVQQFETAYAEEMAWRRQHGISPEAVARVIEERGKRAA
jgi:hypothetical protein